MQEVQITFSPRSHQLTNAQVWTPDSQWLVYDLRPSVASFTSQTVEKVEVTSGEVSVIYRAAHQAHVGVITVCPTHPERFICIHGPENPDQHWHYDFHHRRGVILEQGQATTLDALDITPPFTPGALRGGSHVHMFSPDGSRISFTYNDHVIHQRSAEEDQRNVGVAVDLCPVKITADHPREYSGSHFCVLVSQTTLHPQPGSDQISRAFEEGWVGDKGYQKEDGSWQLWALAFIGETFSAKGEKVPEIFIVDLPEHPQDYRRASLNPIEGTETRLPAPPAGIFQRRLTFSQGVALQPRHWLRSSPDGRAIAFLMADKAGIVQVWTISPQGGNPVQRTVLHSSVQSAFTWNPAGTHITFICDNSVMVCEMASGELLRMTKRTPEPPCAEAVVWSPDGDKIAFMRDIAGCRQLFMVKGVAKDLGAPDVD